jgi:hypothetical protein
MYWHRSKRVLPHVNPSSVQRALLSTVETGYGAAGLKTCATLRTALTRFAQSDDCCRKESVERR